jgi:sulfite reductase alpha subunit-like flavoprotein
MNGHVQGRTALILYGTESGVAQDLAEEVGRVTERLRFSTSIAELNSVPIAHLSSYAITVFVISTTGQGDFPSNSKAFWAHLLRKKLPATFLQDVSFFLVGLGDSSYPKFNWAARKLGKRLKQLGAFEVTDVCEADEQGEDSTDGAFLAWLPLFKAALLENFPIPDGLHPIPDDQPFLSKWLLEHNPAIANVQVDDVSTWIKGEAKAEVIGKINGEDSMIRADHDSRPLPDSFQVRLEENRRMTPYSHWQDVRLLSLITKESINYLPGDALSIMPKNFPDDVNTLILLMDWTSIADASIRFTPTSDSTNLTNYPPCPIPYLASSSHPLTLRTLLTSYLDITSIPRRSLFTTLARYTPDPTHRDRLLEFTQPQYLDEYYDYATRPRRSILEILQEFDSVKIPWQEAANFFPILRGRQFSIASGGKSRKLSNDEGGGTKFELLVAIVKYKTIIKKTRQGVCTRYLASLAPGSTLNVVHRTDGRFTTKPPKQTRKAPDLAEKAQQDEAVTPTPKLLIGAGTGVAPLRALIQHDEETTLLNTKNATPTALFFGTRNRTQDFFFADEWAAKLASNPESSEANPKPSLPPFHLIPSFSRDQPQKIYLQDRLREHSALVFELIVQRNATVVVCGSSGAMPKAVRSALVDVLIWAPTLRGKGKEVGDGDGDGGWTREKAERYLEGMERERRYLQETW